MSDNATGALFSRRGEERGDLKLVHRAIRMKWELDPRYFTILPKIAARIAMDPQANDRDILRAIEVLKAMHGQNLDQDPKELTVNHNHTVASRDELLRLVDRISEREAIDVEVSERNGPGSP